MKKASLFASAAAVSAIGLTAVPAFAQAGGPFADVPTDHWAYQSVDRLQNAGIVIGYPDGTYGGRRAMTRYEFAVAIARLLERIPGNTPAGTAGITQEQLNQALADVARRSDLAGLATKEEVNQIRNLVNEFQNELTTLGVEVDNVRRRLDGVEQRLGFLESEFRRVRIGGAVNLMARANHRQGGGTSSIRDYDGYAVTGGPGSRGGLLADSRVLHDIDLNVTARLSDTATAEAIVNFGNYLPFLNSIASYSGSRSDNPFQPTGPGTVNQDQGQTIYKLAVEAPIRLPGLGGVNLAVGRIPVQFSPYTLKQIDVDSYFSNRKTDLGDIPVDGVRGTFNIGPVGLTAFAAKSDPIKHVSNLDGRISETFPGYGLYAGAGFAPFGAGFTRNATVATPRRPYQSLIHPVFNGAMAVENIAGVRGTFGTGFLGTVGLTYLAMGGRSPVAASQVPGTPDPAGYFDRVYVYGADINTNFGGIGVSGSYTVSNTGTGRARDGGDVDTVNDDDTYAWEAAAGYTGGPFTITGGYRYISPFFAAPGYWDKVGAWTNPVDVQGPFVRASYALGAGLTLAGDAKFYKGTDNGFLTDDDEITSYRVGLKFGLTSASAVDLGAEYTRYQSPNLTDEPREVFYNIGYGFSFNPDTSLKFLYQVVDYSDKGTGFDPLSGRGGVAAAQFSVKF